MSDELRVVGPLAYQGKKDCRDIRCTRRDVQAFARGEASECIGWHCAYCDQPCSSQGHNCDAARAILDESRRIMKEESGGSS